MIHVFYNFEFINFAFWFILFYEKTFHIKSVAKIFWRSRSRKKDRSSDHMIIREKKKKSEKK